MGVESYLVLWVFTDDRCHSNRFRVELMLIESFEIGRLDFPNRDLSNLLIVFCLTFDMRGGPKWAKPACGRPLNGRVRPRVRGKPLRCCARPDQ
jgi:hypothetical protein